MNPSTDENPAEPAPGRGSSQPHNLPPATEFVRLVVSVADIDRALTFYQRLLGLPITSRGCGYAFLRTAAGVEVYLHERSTAPSDLSVAGSFRTSRLDELVAGWVEQGGVVVDQPTDRPWGERMAIVRDPDGHLVCLIDAE